VYITSIAVHGLLCMKEQLLGKWYSLNVHITFPDDPKYYSAAQAISTR